VAKDETTGTLVVYEDPGVHDEDQNIEIELFPGSDQVHIAENKIFVNIKSESDLIGKIGFWLAIAGAVLCIVTLILFAHYYPEQWYNDISGNTYEGVTVIHERIMILAGVGIVALLVGVSLSLMGRHITGVSRSEASTVPRSEMVENEPVKATWPRHEPVAQAAPDTGARAARNAVSRAVQPMPTPVAAAEPSYEPYTYGDYRLYSREVMLRGDRPQNIYFFAKHEPKSGNPSRMPRGYTVKVNERTGMPFLKKIG